MTVIVIGIVAAVIMIVLIFVVIFMYFIKEKPSDEEEEIKRFKPLAEFYISGSSGSTTESFTQPNNMSILKSRNKEPFSLFRGFNLVNFDVDLFKSFQIVIGCNIPHNESTTVTYNGETLDVDNVMEIKIAFVRTDTTSTPNTTKSNYIIIRSTTDDVPLPESFEVTIDEEKLAVSSSLDSLTIKTETEDLMSPENIWGIFAQDQVTLDFIIDDLSSDSSSYAGNYNLYDEVKYKLYHKYISDQDNFDNEVVLLDDYQAHAITTLESMMTNGSYTFYYTSSQASAGWGSGANFGNTLTGTVPGPPTPLIMWAMESNLKPTIDMSMVDSTNTQSLENLTEKYMLIALHKGTSTINNATYTTIDDRTGIEIRGPDTYPKNRYIVGNGNPTNYVTEDLLHLNDNIWADGTNLDTGNQSFSIWMHPREWGSSNDSSLVGSVVCSYGKQRSNFQILDINTKKYVAFWYVSNVSNNLINQYYVMNEEISLNEWVHVCYTIENNNNTQNPWDVKGYMNGFFVEGMTYESDLNSPNNYANNLLDGNKRAPHPVNSLDDVNSLEFVHDDDDKFITFGSQFFSQKSPIDFDVLISNYNLYGTALNATQIQNLFNYY